MSHELLLIYTTYFLATFSPGPSNMAIMSIAVREGRKNAIVLAAGVISGSMTWALVATLGVASVLQTIAGLFLIMKVVGGVYLLYLSYQSGRKIFQRKTPTAGVTTTTHRYFRQGLLMHITNPKAILTWTAIMSLAMKSGLDYRVATETIVGCLLISISVFSFYAIAFSSPAVTNIYKRVERVFQSLLTLFYGVAGIKLLFLKN